MSQMEGSKDTKEKAEIKRLLDNIHGKKDFGCCIELHITAVVTVIKCPAPYSPPYLTLWT